VYTSVITIFCILGRYGAIEIVLLLLLLLLVCIKVLLFIVTHTTTYCDD